MFSCDTASLIKGPACVAVSFIFLVLARAVTEFTYFFSMLYLLYKSLGSKITAFFSCSDRCRSFSVVQVSRCEKFGYGVMMTQVAATAPGVMALHKSGNVPLPRHRFCVFSLFFLPTFMTFKLISRSSSTRRTSVPAPPPPPPHCRLGPGSDRWAMVRSWVQQWRCQDGPT